MGFFSKTCAKTNLPVIHHGYGDDWHTNHPEFSEVVVLYPDGHKVEGFYTGYGEVLSLEGEVSLCPDGYNEELWESLKFVLKKHYAGESYGDLGRSHDEMAQGHFMAEDFILYCKTLKPEGFKDYSGYKLAFQKHAQW
jgi:hypothetical protein